MHDNTELVQNVLQYLAADRQMRSHVVPSKRVVKRQGGGFKNPNKVFKTAGPGSSRSVMLDAVKAIGSEFTGCIVIPGEISSRLKSGLNLRATTSRNNGNIVGGYHILETN